MDRSDLTPPVFEFNKVIEWDEWKHVVVPRIEAASKLPIRHLVQLEPHDGHAIIVGGGPSAPEFIDEIKALWKNPLSTIFSVNAAHQWLIDQGLRPDIHVISEEDVDTVTTALGGQPHKETVYYVCSQLSPDIFQELDGHGQVLWHAATPLEGYQDAIVSNFPGEFMVGGGHATFFKVLTIAHILGYRNFDLFGVDSSFEDNSHLDGYKLSNIEPRINIWGSDPRNDTIKKFTSQGGLVFQTCKFIEFCSWHQAGMKLRVHGDNLLRYVHEARFPEQYQS